MGVISDPISDFLIRLKNASRAENETFTAPSSKMKAVSYTHLTLPTKA